MAGTSFTYDTRGNLTSDGSRTFTYDVENRLLTVSAPTAVTLTYDPTGRLQTSTASSATTTFLYDDEALAAEYNSSRTVLRRYVSLPGEDKPLVWYEGSGTATPRWLHADDQGSVMAYSTSTGANGATYGYGPYGEPDATNGWAGGRYRYTGQIMIPEAQLYYYKARVYDPKYGRFLQTDPIGYKDDNDLYAYGDNDPIDHTDPSGLLNCAAIPYCFTLLGPGDSSSSANFSAPTGGAAAAQAAEQQKTDEAVNEQNAAGVCGDDDVECQKAVYDSPQNQKAADKAMAPMNAMAAGIGAALAVPAAAPLVVGSVDAAPGTTVEFTAHAANASRGGILSVQEVRAVIQVGRQLVQSDGAKVFVSQLATGRFNVVVQSTNTGKIITTLAGITTNALNKLAGNYGWH